MLVLAAASALAQFETSEVVGTVRDASQQAVGKAVVTLLNQETGITAKTSTDTEGNYNSSMSGWAATP